MSKHMDRGCLACCVAPALALALAGMPASAADRAPARKTPAHPAPTVIENCADSAIKLSFRPGESGALLDELDRFLVASEIVQRYPLIERDGYYPSAIALWRRKQGDWVFATLIQRAEPPHALCFSANVAASALSIGPAIARKYVGVTVPALAAPVERGI